MGTKQTKLKMIVLLAVVLAMGSAALGQNVPPVADAGEDQSIYVNDHTGLQGSATDPDNDIIVAWLWTIEDAPEGSSPDLSRTDIPDPLFSGDVAGDYVLSLIAADALAWSEPDYITIHVSELLPPEAVAAADVTSGQAPLTVQFDGSQSVDPQGGTLDYGWSFGDSTPSSWEVSPLHTYERAGEYTAILTVSDTLGQSDFDYIVITVTEGCLFVDPGSEGYYIYGYQPVGSTNPQTFTITNTCTSDLEISSIGLEDGSSEDYAITNSPSLPLSLAPGGTTEVEVTFTPSTTYFAEATLVIQTNDPSVAKLSVWLTTSMNVPPVADAGEDQSIFLGESALLQGSATDENHDIIVAWLWTIEDAPDGSSPYLSDPHRPDPLFFPDVVGDYVLSLIAADAGLWSEPDYITIRVSELLPPEAVASADVTSGQAPLTVQFDGSQSVDPQGGQLNYIWNFGDGTLRSGEVSPLHTYERAGEYTATLTVFDTLGQSDFDFIVITVTPGGNIQVSPESYDFGDVELGTLSSTIITITNPLGGIDEDPLELLDISLAEGSSGDFAITDYPATSTVQPGESVEVGITFTPTAVDYACAILQINSDDPVFPNIEVVLGGTGVSDEDPPEGQIAAILISIDAAVDAGTLVGEGSGNSAGNRLNAFENMIEAAGDLIEDSLYTEASDQLGDALKKCDGQPSPPDFVTGDAAEVVKGMIEVLRTTLGCQ